MAGKSPWGHLRPRTKAGAMTVVIESPAGSRNKYKHDRNRGLFRLVRVLPGDEVFPYDYGYIPGTQSGDGDPLDAMLIGQAPTFPGCVVRARLVGVLRATKSGEQNDRVLLVPSADKAFAEVHDLGDLPAHVLSRIERFFATVLTEPKHDVGRLEGVVVARRLIELTIARAKGRVKRQRRSVRPGPSR